ncbi:MAG: hypothetical protein AAGA31_20110 [Bacteroidota bacterium]
MQTIAKSPSLTLLLMVGVFLALSCQDQSEDQESLSNLEGTIIFPQAGDIFSYDLQDRSIDFFAESKGRQGPFFSSDGLYFTTGNWPGNNEGVALWSLDDRSITREFTLNNTLNQDEKGLKVSPGTRYFSGIVNTGLGNDPDLIILNEDAQQIGAIGQNVIRVKGHVWDREQNLYITGEVLEGEATGLLFMAKVTNLANLSTTLIRTFDGEFFDVPDELSISPNGTQIAYAYQRSIWVGSTIEGAEDHRVCLEATQTLARPTFSPDGKYLALAMLNSSNSLRGDIHVAEIPQEGSLRLEAEGATKLPGPNGSTNSTWTSGDDSSMGWFNF